MRTHIRIFACSGCPGKVTDEGLYLQSTKYYCVLDMSNNITKDVKNDTLSEKCNLRKV